MTGPCFLYTCKHIIPPLLPNSCHPNPRELFWNPQHPPFIRAKASTATSSISFLLFLLLPFSLLSYGSTLRKMIDDTTRLTRFLFLTWWRDKRWTTSKFGGYKIWQMLDIIWCASASKDNKKPLHIYFRRRTDWANVVSRQTINYCSGVWGHQGIHFQRLRTIHVYTLYYLTVRNFCSFGLSVWSVTHISFGC